MLRNSLNARATRPASALVMAALAAALLASAAALMLIEARAARAASGETARILRAELAAEQLLAIAITRLDAGEPLAPQGVLFTNDAGARVLRQDASGLIDVNAAAPETLARALAAFGADADRAAQLADRIADWRDEDNLTRLLGAEAEDYRDAGLAPPGNRPFESEGEIVQVLGMTPDLLACALPWLTTYSGQSEIDPAAAAARVRALLALADETRLESAAPLGRVIALTAEAPLSEHAIIRRTLWLRLTGDPTRPVMIHRGEQTLAPRAAPSPCEATGL